MPPNNIPENQGGEVGFDALGSSKRGATGTAGLNVDRTALNSLTGWVRDLGSQLKSTTNYATQLVTTLGKLGSIPGAGGRPSSFGGSSGRISVPLAGSVSSGVVAGAGGGGGGISVPTAGGAGAGGGGPVSGALSSLQGVSRAVMQPFSDLNAYVNQRAGQGAEYSLQADRMSVQLQQMYGMSNAAVRNQLRMPLTTHYLLGGGEAVNQLLGMQATTGLTAGKQASTVEAFRTISGFSYGAGDVTRMLSTMAAPETANRMFMMGGTGMYGIGGKERTGMQSIQDIVRRTGLTNPEALKGALQQGSNTRQRLNAMGVPQDMQDMVIQYAMQNAQYQKRTGGSAMYDPSMEENRRTMGIEGSYAVQHEKTTGERLKREERFYGRQADNFADFERNLRSTTKILAAFEDKLSAIVGAKISYANQPIVKAASYGVQYGMNVGSSVMNFAAQVGDLATAVGVPGGDPIDGMQGKPRSIKETKTTSSDSGKKLPKATESKLANLDPKLAVPLRKMLEERPDIGIGDTVRTTEQQENSFLKRYRRTDRTEKLHETDRIWNGVVWEMKPEALKQNLPAMAPPGQSYHEIGLAADLDIHGDTEKINWVKENAARFGLDTGATGRGGSGDEPFHIQPQGTGLGNYGKGKETSSSSSQGFVRKTGTSGSVRTATMTSKRSTPVVISAPTAKIDYQAPYRGNSELIYTGSKTNTTGGDPIDGSMSPRITSSTGGSSPSIVISPNIYIQGGQSISNDMRRVAQEVGRLLEHEVKLTMMRGS